MTLICECAVICKFTVLKVDYCYDVIQVFVVEGLELELIVRHKTRDVEEISVFV